MFKTVSINLFQLLIVEVIKDEVVRPEKVVSPHFIKATDTLVTEQVTKGYGAFGHSKVLWFEGFELFIIKPTLK